MQVDDVGGPAAIDVSQPNAPVVELIRVVEMRRVVHRHLGAETAIAKVGPVADLAVADAGEIGEAVAYWTATYKNKRLPKPVKRGLADALVRLCNEYSSAKYNGQGKAWSLGQLIQFLHPSPQDVPSVAPSAPLPTWADAAEQGRQAVRAGLVEQNLPVVARLADRVYVMKEGKIFQELATRAEIEATGALERNL